MPSPFPGMDPFLEKDGIFHELHLTLLVRAQGQLQSQLRPNYVARLDRPIDPADEIAPEDVGMSRQRRLLVYELSQPRRLVTCIELVYPANKVPDSASRRRFLERRAAALEAGCNWVEIDLLRGGERTMSLIPPVPGDFDYLRGIDLVKPQGRTARYYGWGVRNRLAWVCVPLAANTSVNLDLDACFREAYDAIAADEEAGYKGNPPPPPLRPEDQVWVDDLLRQKGLRP